MDLPSQMIFMSNPSSMSNNKLDLFKIFAIFLVDFVLIVPSVSKFLTPTAPFFEAVLNPEIKLR